MDLAPLHLSFADLDTHTRVLTFVLALGPVLLLALVTWVQLRRVGDGQAEAAPRSSPGR